MKQRRVATVALIAAMILSAASAGPPEGLRPLERDQVHRMLRAMREQIETYYFDPAFGGVDLQKGYAAADERINRATNLSDALSAIAQFAMELEDSHTYFVPPRETVTVDYGWTMQMIGDVCYIVAVKRGSDASRQNVGAGDRVVAINGYRPSRANLWKLRYMFQILRPQPGLHVELVSVRGEARELNVAADVKPRSRITDLNNDAGLQLAEIEFERSIRSRKSFFVTSEPDVVIWRLPSFSVPEADIEYGLRTARHAKGLILDLRGNGGGSEYILLRLLSGLNQADVTIGTSHTRTDDKPLIARGGGTSAYDGQLEVLVDSQSASASELLARTIQLAKRGTVFGDHTAGSVMQGRAQQEFAAQGEYRALFATSVSSADILMSDGGRLERIGVIPDIEALPSASDLAEQQDPVLAEALKALGHPTDPKRAGQLLRPFHDAQR